MEIGGFVSAHNLMVSLQVILPTVAFGAIMLAVGSGRVARLLGLRRRPFRSGKRQRPFPQRAAGAPRFLPIPIRPTPQPQVYWKP